MGATTRDIAVIVMSEVLLLIVLGSTVAALLAAALQPAISSWALQVLQVDFVLLEPGSLSRLVIGAALLAVLGGAYPALRSVRMDPLEALER